MPENHPPETRGLVPGNERNGATAGISGLRGAAAARRRFRPFVWTGEDIVVGAQVFADAAAAIFKAGRTRYFLFSMFHKNAIGASTTPVR
jgi:hypothetical protein